MKVTTCRYAGAIRAAVDDGDALYLLPPGFDALAALRNPQAASQPGGSRVEFADVQFLPPILAPEKILCVGINYRDHAAESSQADEPKFPSLFARFPSSQVGHRQPIVAPAISEKFDYEGELAVVIGQSAWRVSRGDALRCVAGYSCFAENSVRDFQNHGRQVTAGKNFLASGAFGPWITSADEVGDPASLTLTTRLNGEVVQHAALSSLIFPVDALIAYISQFTRLMPGDVIATGTPAGVGALRSPPLWMKPGDFLEVDIPRVGLLQNRVAAELH